MVDPHPSVSGRHLQILHRELCPATLRKPLHIMAEDLCSAEVVRFRFLGTPFASRTIAGLAEEFGARLMTDHFLYCFKVVNEEMAGNENHRDTVHRPFAGS